MQISTSDLKIGQNVYVVINSTKPLYNDNIVSGVVKEKNARFILLATFHRGFMHEAYIDPQIPLDRLREALVERKHYTMASDYMWSTLFYVAVATTKEIAEMLYLQFIKIRQERLKTMLKNSFILKIPTCRLGLNEIDKYKLLKIDSLTYDTLKISNLRTYYPSTKITKIGEVNIFEMNAYAIGPNPQEKQNADNILMKEAIKRHKAIEKYMFEELKKFIEDD